MIDPVDHGASDEREDPRAALLRTGEVVTSRTGDELVFRTGDDVASRTGNEVVANVLQPFLDAERGLRAPDRHIPNGLTEQVPELLQKLVDDLAAAHELTQQADARATRRSYGWHATRFVDWCQERALMALPATPATVAAHLASYALRRSDDGTLSRGPDDELLSKVTPGTVALRLAAINKLHELAGLPRPGESVIVRRLMQGLRRTFLVRPRNAKAAIDHAALRRLLAAANADTLGQARRRAILLLRVRTGGSAGQLAALHWADVTFDPSGVRADLPPSRAGGACREVVVPRHPDPRLCLLEALTELRKLSPHLREVIVKSAGQPLTRQAIHLSIQDIAARHGGWAAVPAASDSMLITMLDTPGLPERPKALRDSSMITWGWYAAFRRGDLCGLNWGDLQDLNDEGFEALIVKSKTDQEGVGYTAAIPCLPADPEMCPATAMRRWRQHVALLIGGDPSTISPTDPVFCRIDRHGTVQLGQRLSGAAVNAIVQELCVAARLESADLALNAYGSHSLRVGFITEALRDDKLSISEVQTVSRHKDVNVLIQYRREVNALAFSPSRKLAKKLLEKSVPSLKPLDSEPEQE